MSRARIHELYERPLAAEEIERESFRRIDAEARAEATAEARERATTEARERATTEGSSDALVSASVLGFSPAQWEVARRLVHTSADFSLLPELAFLHDPITQGLAALRRGAPIYADSNMIRAGLSMARLSGCSSSYGPEHLHVHVADADVSASARAERLPRAIYALRKARPVLEGGIVCFGNSPVGLLELNRMILEEGIRPALVVAMPVGFVHVVESKEELMNLDVPQIVIRGRRGGSPLAVATLHALCTLATEDRS